MAKRDDVILAKYAIFLVLAKGGNIARKAIIAAPSIKKMLNFTQQM